MQKIPSVTGILCAKCRKIPCMYVHVYQITKNRGPGPCNSLRHADNRKYFSGLSLTRNRGKMCTCFTWRGKWEKFGDVLAEKKVSLSWLMNSNMVKPEKFEHLHLVYHFTLTLNEIHKPSLFFNHFTHHMLNQILSLTNSHGTKLWPFNQSYLATIFFKVIQHGYETVQNVN